MSFLLLATFCAFAAAAAGVAVERRRGRAAPPPPAPAAAAAADPFDGAGLPLGLGDVVAAEGAERWLAGALELRDGEHLVAVVFVAPEGGVAHAVCAFAPPRREVVWGSPRPAEIGGEPPPTLELGGVVMQRRARLPVSIRRHGRGAPDVGDVGTFAEYAAGARDVAVVLRGSGGPAIAWGGVRLAPEEYDRMGRGEG